MRLGMVINLPRPPPAQIPAGAANVAIGLVATPASARTLKVSVDSFKNGGAMPNKYAFCVPAAQGHLCSAARKSSQARLRNAVFVAEMMLGDPGIIVAEFVRPQDLPRHLRVHVAVRIGLGVRMRREENAEFQMS